MPRRIIGPPSANWATISLRVQNRTNINPRFYNQMFAPIWQAGLDLGVDPVGMIAQAIKETAGGNFTGNVKPEFFNTCGLKIRYNHLFPGVTDGDLPLAHQMFPNWPRGARAQAEHLRAYPGWPLDEMASPVDPRSPYALKNGPIDWVETFSGLGGKWAPSLSYGFEIENIMYDLTGISP